MKSPDAAQKQSGRFGPLAKTLATVVFCLLFWPLGGFAKTLAEYRESVESAAKSTQALAEYVNGAADGLDENPAYERELLAALRKSLPPKEKVEWEGSSVETDNQWLTAKLKEYEEKSDDWAKRATILAAVGERLKALERKIAELEKPALASRSKDEDKQKLAEILRREEYQKPTEKAESWFERLQRRIKEWFDQKFPRPEISEETSQGVQTFSFGLQMLLYAVVLGFIAFLIYRFAPFFAARFRRREKSEKRERVILGEKLAAHEDAQTLFDEAEALARGGNLRGAIRKGYIALLCELSDRKVIGLAQHKTNRDYLRDVRKERDLYRNMHGLTASFERHWYGFERVDENDWDEFKRNYQKTVSESH